MLTRGSGEFSGTSIMRMPASMSAVPTATASFGVNPRRIATIGATPCDNKCEICILVHSFRAYGEQPQPGDGAKIAIELRCFDRVLGECLSIESRQAWLSHHGHRAADCPHAQHRGDFVADQHAGQESARPTASSLLEQLSTTSLEQRLGHSGAAAAIKPIRESCIRIFP